MGSLRESEVANTIANLREAEQHLAIIRSKKTEAMEELKKLGVKPSTLDSELQRLDKEIEELSQVIERRVRKARHVIEQLTKPT